MEYVIEEQNGTHNIYEIAKNDTPKKLVAVAFEKVHARLIANMLNKYNERMK